MNLFDSMVERRDPRTLFERWSALREVMQEIALAGLARGGFFDRAAFYGGTCLHLFHGLDRFSEDLDFSLLSPDPEFDFESFFPAVKEEFAMAGKEIEIRLKRKGRPSSIESAFLKETTDVFDIGFPSEKRAKIKIEVDVLPPPGFETERKLLLEPSSQWIRVYSAGDLFAGKISAVLFREWRNRVKGRDWYDFEWYVRAGTNCGLRHLIERGKEIAPNEDLSSRDAVVAALKRKIETVDFAAARDDVRPFLADDSRLSIWSREYFDALAEKINVSE